jgi:hypothetical protein
VRPEHGQRHLRSEYLPGPQQLRQQERHEQKLKDIQEQVAQGKLVIRKMTASERKRYPPREAGGRGFKRQR